MPSGSRLARRDLHHRELAVAAGRRRRDRSGDVARPASSGRPGSAGSRPACYPAYSAPKCCSIAGRSGSARSSRARRAPVPARRAALSAGGCAGARLARIFHRRHRRRAAGVEQRHRHLEGAEHDHDHAGADQQRADLGGDGRGACLGLVAPWPCRQPWPWRQLCCGARGLLVGWRGGGGLRGAARGGDEARRADRLFLPAAEFR